MVKGRPEITFDIISVNVGIKSMANDFLHQSEVWLYLLSQWTNFIKDGKVSCKKVQK